MQVLELTGIEVLDGMPGGWKPPALVVSPAVDRRSPASTGRPAGRAAQRSVVLKLTMRPCSSTKTREETPILLSDMLRSNERSSTAAQSTAGVRSMDGASMRASLT